MMFYYFTGGIYMNKEKIPKGKKGLWITPILLLIITIPVFIYLGQNREAIAGTENNEEVENSGNNQNGEENNALTEEEILEIKKEIYEIIEDINFIEDEEEKDEKIAELLEKIGWTLDEYAEKLNKATELGLSVSRKKASTMEKNAMKQSLSDELLEDMNDDSPESIKKAEEAYHQALLEIGLNVGDLRRYEAEKAKGSNVRLPYENDFPNVTPAEKFEIIENNLTKEDEERNNLYKNDPKLYEDLKEKMRRVIGERWKAVNGLKTIKLPDGVKEIKVNEEKIVFTSFKGDAESRIFFGARAEEGVFFTIFALVGFIFEDGNVEEVLIETSGVDRNFETEQMKQEFEERRKEMPTLQYPPRLGVLGANGEFGQFNFEHQIDNWEGQQGRYIMTDWIKE